MGQYSCVVIIPLYQPLTSIERRFLENGLDKTTGFEQIVIAPQHLEIDGSFGRLSTLQIVRFPDHYFKNIEGYNKLMLSAEFYQSFSTFDYMLIHQADVFLFKNELAKWCDKNYDYIGAPWYRPEKLNKGKIYAWLYAKIWQPRLTKNRKNGWLYNKVGNGGLSLRRIGTAIECLELAPEEMLNDYRNTKSPHYNEDVFWSIEAPKILDRYSIPKWQEALQFAVEFKPEIAIRQLGNELPFGCHAPLLNNPEFWSAYIPLS